MKLKLKIDKDAILRFGLNHVEKFAFAGVVVVFGTLVYGALLRESYSRMPNQLQEASDNAQAHWSATEAAVPDECQAPVYLDIITTALEPIDKTPYDYDARWKPDDFERPGLRPTPPVFPVQQLRPIAGRGPFSLRGQQGGVAPVAAIGGQRWVVVTGLVQKQRQFDAYEEAFTNVVALNPETDIPNYIYYRVARAEVNDANATGELKWDVFHLGNELKRIEDWARTDPEIVGREYVDPEKKLVFPLGPRLRAAEAAGGRVGRGVRAGADSAWGAEAAYPPHIPLVDKKTAPAGRRPAARPAAAGPDDPGLDFPIPDGPTADPVGVAVDPTAEEQEPQYWLFRFFDYTVEPGKKYRYRVLLMLDNPNKGIASHLLQDPEDAAKKWLETEWSEPTEVVSVPRDTKLLAVSVKPPIRPWEEPSGRLKVVKWVNRHGKEAFTEQLVRRGQVANFPGLQFPEPTGKKFGKGDDDMPGHVASKNKGGQPINVDYLTEAITLDMLGGWRLPGKDSLTVPGEILLLDSDGSLIIRGELARLEEQARAQASAAAAAAAGEDTPSGIGPAPPPAGPPGDGMDLLDFSE